MTTRKQKWEGKQVYGRFKRLINNISHQKIWTWLRKGNLKIETESLLIAAQDNAIRTNHIKARIDKTQQNSKCRLCGDRDETINHIISKCSKLAQKEYKARHDWVGKVIHREMCRKFQFDHNNKWYMHNPAPVHENDSHKLLWDFNIQTDHIIPARRPDIIIINKKMRIWKIVDFAVPTDPRINLKESEKKDKYIDLAREIKKLWNMKVTILPIVIGALGTVTKGLLKGLEDLEIGGRVETIQTTALLRTVRMSTCVCVWNQDIERRCQLLLYIYIYIYTHSHTHTHIYIYILYINRDIGPAVRVFANGPGDLGSIPGRVIPKTLKMELDTTLLNTQHYKVRFKGKVEQSREWSSALPYTLV